MSSVGNAAFESAELAARTSYGRLLAFLAARSRDIETAEDALSEAFAAAIEQWPASGVPANPEAWLLTAARRRLADGARRQRVRDAAIPTLLRAADEAQEHIAQYDELDDDRLKLLFVCAHPAIDPAVRTPLMLQAVMRLDASRIASVFCVSPAAMARKLSRAKQRIRVAAISFEVPEPEELPARLDAVLEAIYGAYGSGWDDVAGEDPRRSSLAAEAIFLGRLIAQRLPNEPEALGLLSLMLHSDARRLARRNSLGEYIPLADQDCGLWSRSQIEEAEALLAQAATAGRMGRFQLEAAIQSAHAHRLVTGRTDWEAVALLYEGLVRLWPTLGARVGRSAAVARARGAAAGLALLDDIPSPSADGYQPFWALAAHLLAAVGRTTEAQGCFQRAIGLCDDPAMREFLQRRSLAVEKGEVLDLTFAPA